MSEKSRTVKILLPATVSTQFIRRAGVVAALIGVGAAVPAALFTEPIAMGLAAGAASVAAFLGAEMSHRKANRAEKNQNPTPSQLGMVR